MGSNLRKYFGFESMFLMDYATLRNGQIVFVNMSCSDYIAARGKINVIILVSKVCF